MGPSVMPTMTHREWSLISGQKLQTDRTALQLGLWTLSTETHRGIFLKATYRIWGFNQGCSPETIQRSGDDQLYHGLTAEAQQHGKISGRDAQGELIPKLVRFHSSSKDGTAGCFSEQGPAQSECATNTFGQLLPILLQIARLQRLLGHQRMKFFFVS